MTINQIQTTRLVDGEVQVDDLCVETRKGSGVTTFRVTAVTNIRRIVDQRSSDMLLYMAQHRFTEAIKLIAQDVELLRSTQTQEQQ